VAQGSASRGLRNDRCEDRACVNARLLSRRAFVHRTSNDVWNISEPIWIFPAQFGSSPNGTASDARQQRHHLRSMHGWKEMCLLPFPAFLQQYIALTSKAWLGLCVRQVYGSWVSKYTHLCVRTTPSSPANKRHTPTTRESQLLPKFAVLLSWKLHDAPVHVRRSCTTFSSAEECHSPPTGSTSIKPSFFTPLRQDAAP